MFKRILDKLIEFQRHNAERRMLECLSDKQLKDIGINRSDIAQIFSTPKK